MPRTKRPQEKSSKAPVLIEQAVPTGKDRGGRRSNQGRMDIRTVAQEAGVSIATVSRVMNGVTTVDPRLSEAVWAAVGQLNYVPNTQARALVSGKSRLFGVIISDITNPFFPELIQGFEEEAVAVGYETLIGSTRREPRQMEACIQRMLERKVDGVAVMTFGIEAPLLDRLSYHGVPLVFVDEAPPGDRTSAIVVDYKQGIREGVEHLATLGHRRIAFIAGPASLHSAVARQAAFRESIAEADLPLPAKYVYEGDHTAEGGMRAIEALLALPEPPTAVMCSNDMTAIGVMHTAFNAGLNIPNDLSVIGFDDIHLARYALPPLTSILMSRHDLASAAVRLLKMHVDDGQPMEPTAKIPTSLVVRQSTAPPR